MADLDQSGLVFQKVNTYLGPSLGWVPTRVKPERTLTVAGTYNATPDDGVIFVNVAGLVSINLPDSRLWMQEFGYNPATAFERAIWVKDLGGNAGSFNITVNPFPGQRIDTQATATITTNFGILRLYPLFDFTGWFGG